MSSFVLVVTAASHSRHFLDFDPSDSVQAHERKISSSCKRSTNDLHKKIADLEIENYLLSSSSITSFRSEEAFRGMLLAISYGQLFWPTKLAQESEQYKSADSSSDVGNADVSTKQHRRFR